MKLFDMPEGWRFLRGRNTVAHIILLFIMSLSVATLMTLARAVYTVRFYNHGIPNASSLYVARWKRGKRFSDSLTVTAANYWSLHSKAFEGMALYGGTQNCVVKGDNSGSMVLSELPASSALFPLLQTNPIAGRVFNEHDEVSPDETVAVLSYKTSIRLYQAPSLAIGEVIKCGNRSLRIIGVLPENFDYFPNPGIWSYARFVDDPSDLGNNYKLVGRLRPGVTKDELENELKQVFKGFAASYPQQIGQHDDGAAVMAWNEWLIRNYRDSLNITIMITAMLGSLVLTNGLIIQLLIGMRKRPENVVEMVLGASRTNILAKAIKGEVALVGTVGLIAYILSRPLAVILIRVIIGSSSNIAEPREGVASTVLLGLILAILFVGLTIARLGAIPRSINPSILTGRQLDAAEVRALKPVRAVLIGFQLALSLVVLIVDNSLVNGLHSLRNTALGMNPAELVSIDLEIDSGRVSSTSYLNDLLASISDRLSGQHLLLKPAFATAAPLSPGLNTLLPTLSGGNCDKIATEYRGVSPTYFETLGIPFIRGTAFISDDYRGNTSVAIVNTAFLAHCRLDGPILKQSMRIEGDESRRIIGIVGDVREHGIEAVAPPVVYVPLNQITAPLNTLSAKYYYPAIISRSTNSPQEKVVRGAINSIAPGVPVVRMHRLDEDISSSIARQTAIQRIGTFAALMALVLTCTGIYGIIDTEIRDRRREIAIRIALGSPTIRIYTMLVNQVWIVLAVGFICAGLIVAYIYQHYLVQVQWLQGTLTSAAVIGLIEVLFALGVTAFVALRGVLGEKNLKVLRE